jgi:CRISPR system Cascade subunit CasC
MAQLLQIHLIQSYPPALLNRGRDNAPKSAWFGAAPRGLISSQCLKHNMRQLLGDMLAEADLSIRTGYFDRVLEPALAGLGATDAEKAIVLQAVAALGRKLPKKTDGDDSDAKPKRGRKKKEQDEKPTAVEAVEESAAADEAEIVTEDEVGKPEPGRVMLLLGRDEIAQLAERMLEQLRGGLARGTPSEQIAQNLLGALGWTNPRAIDLALFGRMTVGAPVPSVDAASYSAFALTVNSIEPSVDFWTAADDLAPDGQHHADHIGEMVYHSNPVFYIYHALDLAQLARNLGNDSGRVRLAAQAYVRATLFARPTGKAHALAPFTLPSLALIEAGPVALNAANAFEQPVRGSREVPLTRAAAERLMAHLGSVETMYGLERDRVLLWDTPADATPGVAAIRAKTLDDLLAWVGRQVE